MMATLQSKICIPEDVLFKELDGEAVILNMESGKYYGLDEVGTRMWETLSQHGQVELACQALLEEYDVAEDRLQQDLLELVDKLVSEGLLQIDDA